MTPIITQLDSLLQTRRGEIEDWLHTKRNEHPPYFYTSVDLRHSGTRLAPVDTNLFPAGFNNLSPLARHRSMRLMHGRLRELVPNISRVLIVPENHTRNLYYLENLAVLKELLEKAGVEVQIGNLTTTDVLELTAVSGRP